MEAFVTAGAGFLLAVLWFDLMHDVLVRGHDRSESLPEDALVGITTYYARVTTAAQPMNLLVAAAMVVTLTSIVVELVSDFDPVWVPVTSLVAALVGIGTAVARTVPSAVRLSTRADDVTEQSRLARVVYRDHCLAFVCMTFVLAVQLGSAAS